MSKLPTIGEYVNSENGRFLFDDYATGNDEEMFKKVLKTFIDKKILSDENHLM